MANEARRADANPEASIEVDVEAKIARPAPQRSAADRTVIGAEMRIDGSVSCGSAIQVSGEVLGAVTSAADVDVEADGVVKGSLTGCNVTVSGTVEGPVNTTGRLLIRSSGRVLGAIEVKSILIEEGGQLRGRCSMLP